MKLWPFRRQKAKPIHQPVNSLPARPSMSPIKQQALIYLDATLAVLRREHIPLAQPVHGKPARGARFIEIPINLDRRRVGPMAMRKVFNAGTVSTIQAAARVDNINVWQVRDALVYQYQLDKTLWKYYKRADLPSPDGIGLGVGRTLVQFSLDSKNTLVAGETRSGKSVTIESMLFALMDSYACDELGLIIIDPNQTLGIRKEGLRAIEASSFSNAAHLLQPIATSSQQVEQAINFVYHQWQHRMRNGIQDAPAMVLVIDELMSEVVIGDKEARNYNEAHLAKLSQLASQGIKNNIFLIVGAQDPKIGNTSGLLMRNLGLRYIGHVTDEQASRVLAGRGGVNAHLLTGNGDFVQVAEDTMVRFQVAEPTRRDFERLKRRPVEAQPVGQVDIIDVPVPPPAEEPVPEFDLSLLLAADEASTSNTQICVDARTLAIYFYEKKISIAQARQKYGIGRVIHTRHRDFALELVDEIKHLATGQPSQSPYVKSDTKEAAE